MHVVEHAAKIGVTAIIRALGFAERYYDRLLDFFHSPAVDVYRLTRCWVKLLFARLPGIYRANGRPVLLGDGLKNPKRGRKMPAYRDHPSLRYDYRERIRKNPIRRSGFRYSPIEGRCKTNSRS